jgi:hypothetical protein
MMAGAIWTGVRGVEGRPSRSSGRRARCSPGRRERARSADKGMCVTAAATSEVAAVAVIVFSFEVAVAILAAPLAAKAQQAARTRPRRRGVTWPAQIVAA